jgi:hypothetical protein
MGKLAIATANVKHLRVARNELNQMIAQRVDTTPVNTAGMKNVQKAHGRHFSILRKRFASHL